MVIKGLIKLKIIKGYTVIQSIILYNERLYCYFSRFISFIRVLILSLIKMAIYPLKMILKGIFKTYVWLKIRFIKLKKWLKKRKREILLVISWLIGHFLLTWGLVDILGSVIWKLSYGILFLGIGGWKLGIQILKVGFYALSEKD